MAASGLSGVDFRVGDWIVQPRLARIRCGAEAVHVTPRAMSVLVYLAENGGKVVARNELLDAIWPRLAVTQDALTQCVVELRKAFRDDPRRPKVIETIPKIGVRLIASVTSADGALPAASTPPGHGPETANARSRLVATVAAALAVFGIALWVLQPWTGERARRVERSLAVLPFTNESAPDAEVEFFVRGLHDELLSRLANVDALDKVIARTSVLGYRDTDKSVQEIARELGVTTILEGRAQRMGDAMRLNMQLVDAETNGILWGGRRSDRRRDCFGLCGRQIADGGLEA